MSLQSENVTPREAISFFYIHAQLHRPLTNSQERSDLPCSLPCVLTFC